MRIEEEFSLTALFLFCSIITPAFGQHTLSGRIYEGEYLAEPPDATGLAGVVVKLYASGNPDVLGVEIDSYTTSSDGWYGLTTQIAGEFFTIVCEGKENYTFQDSSSVDGVSAGEQIQYVIPLDSKTRTGNKFWYLPDGEDPQNQPPAVEAGQDHISSLPLPLPHPIDLAGSVTDDGLPGGELFSEWSLLEGPAEVQFENANDPCTVAIFAEYGAYILRLTATDGEHEAFDDVLVELMGEEEPPQCLLRQDLDRNTIVDIRDLAIFASAWLESTPHCEARATTQPQTAQQQMASVLIPTYMYYVERYFSDVPDKTDIDLQIKAILDESEAGRRLLLAALGNYQNTSAEMKHRVYDPETVAATAMAGEPLDLGLIQDRVAEMAPGLAWGLGGTPAAPSSLVATNTSAWDEEFPSYQITLTWQDNSGDEDGFRIYRVAKPAGATVSGKLQLVDSVGPNITTYVDKLSKPATAGDQYCYQVVAYRVSLVALVGQPATIIESNPSNGACAYYSTSPPPPPTDTDKDGVPDFLDDCPNIAGVLTHGCPDADLDGIPNIVEGSGALSDMCPTEKGLPQGKYVPATRHGCPQQYNLRWMKMEIKNNTGAYAYPGYKFIPDKGLYANEVYNDNKYGDGSGEEPYLLFSFINGKFQGMPAAWTSQWCCGEGVDVKKGKAVEPDSDSFGEEYPGQLSDILANGLTVFPGVGDFDIIDKDLGLTMTVSLMERDYDITVVEDQADAFSAAIKSGKAVVGAVAGCVGSGGAGCLAGIAGAMKTVIEEIFNLSKKPKTTTIDDPDDFEGANSWAVSRMEAYSKTSKNGAYAFYMDMPTTVYKSCLGWTPCPVATGVPTTMQVRVYFCLYREGIADADIKKLCSPFMWVVPVK